MAIRDPDGANKIVVKNLRIVAQLRTLSVKAIQWYLLEVSME